MSFRGDGFPTVTGSPEETRRLARRVAATLDAGDVVALYGELGAGKTEFVRGACEAMGVNAEDVSSPTFTIVNEYRGRRLPIYHIDAYRVKTPDEFFELGYNEYFDGTGVCFIEWPDRVESLLRGDVIRLRFEHRGPAERLISLLE